ncbi:hypothetical protein [Fructilactobacillus florum]|uniref:hypothetical protein n=1 Tax=Fructilactobacillus florum TaxID=640331 RepID=UPI0006D09D1B|nr:hypothetical protein [Fructilactobacillus florum]
MRFQNFSNFKFNMKMLAQPLTITTDDGTQTVNEPLVNQSNPNINFQSIVGGELEVGTMFWLSKLHVDKGTRVTDASGTTYQVASIAQDVAGGIMIYSLKENSNRRREGDSDF